MTLRVAPRLGPCPWIPRAPRSPVAGIMQVEKGVSKRACKISQWLSLRFAECCTEPTTCTTGAFLGLAAHACMYLEDVVVVRNVDHPPLAAAAEDDLGLVRPALTPDRDGIVLGAIDLPKNR